MPEPDAGQDLEITVGATVARVHYHESGPADGPPVVFVHTGGAAVSAWMCWYQTMPAFAAAGYHVLAPDSMNAGETKVVAGPPITTVAILAALLDAKSVRAAHFIANSGGAMAAMTFATNYSERVLSFIVSGGEPRATTPEAAAIAPRLGRTARMDFVRAMLSRPSVSFDEMREATAAFFYDTTLPVIDNVAALRLSTLQQPGRQEYELKAAIGQLEGGRQLLADAAFRAIKAPTYLLHGRDEPGFYAEADRPALLDAALRPMHLIERCDATVLANCGHWPQLEMPERHNELCLAFLRRVELR